MVLYKRLIIFILLCIVSSLNLLSCYTNTITDLEKIKIFYQYDYLFHYGGYNKNTSIEKSSSREIFNIKKVSKEYQEKAKEYIEIISAFISSNIEIFKKFYIAANDFTISEDKSLLIYNNTYNLISNDLLPNLPGAIRCMVGTYDSQYIEVAIRIEENIFAVTVKPGYADHTYWKDYYKDDPPPYINKVGIIDSQGVIKYPEWFYESNLKVRVVKQIRDKDGKYYGEIYADYYKLDEYDKLFDKDGNPKQSKEDNK